MRLVATFCTLVVTCQPLSSTIIVAIPSSSGVAVCADKLLTNAASNAPPAVVKLININSSVVIGVSGNGSIGADFVDGTSREIFNSVSSIQEFSSKNPKDLFLHFPELVSTVCKDLSRAIEMDPQQFRNERVSVDIFHLNKDGIYYRRQGICFVDVNTNTVKANLGEILLRSTTLSVPYFSGSGQTFYDSVQDIRKVEFSELRQDPLLSTFLAKKALRSEVSTEKALVVAKKFILQASIYGHLVELHGQPLAFSKESDCVVLTSKGDYPSGKLNPKPIQPIPAKK